MRFHVTSFLLAALAASNHHDSNTGVSASFASPVDDEPQCTGLHIAFDRLQPVEPEEINMLAPSPQSMFGVHNYGVSNIVDVTDAVTSECKLQRHRLYEKVGGHRVLGGEAIVTLSACVPQTDQSIGEQQPLDNVEMGTISKFEGTTLEVVEEEEGYTPTKTEDEAIAALAEYFQTPATDIGDLATIIFPSLERGDFLAYRSEVWVSTEGDIQLFDVFMSAHTLEILQSCKKINSQRIQRRNLREQQQQQQNDNNDNDNNNSNGHRALDVCESCANQDRITWTGEEVECPINSLYLNNTNRNATCLKGTDTSGREVFGPGPVGSLHYGGTYDCNSSEDICNANELPTGCSDALSDIHYGITQSLKFNQDYLGVMGGMKVSAATPQVFSSFVHFANRYCNAFFTTQTNSLYFGDCDCNTWTPLTSVDVAAHELAHGLTTFSSELIYSHQPGGLNEGYSDIMGATMEFYINDSIDTPDFNLGENLIGAGLEGSILRYMENPSQDGKSIDNICKFTNNVNVHFSSGVLNKAFVSAVRSCEADACSTDLRECVLFLGPMFMYANIHKLQALSGYLDSASQTCGIVEEFISVRSPTTNCTAPETQTFLASGWASAGVTINSNCAARATDGCYVPATPANAGSALSCFAAMRLGLQSVISWIVSPFKNE